MQCSSARCSRNPCCWFLCRAELELAAQRATRARPGAIDRFGRAGFLFSWGQSSWRFAVGSWQGLAVRGRNLKVGERGWPGLAGGRPSFPQAFGSEREHLVCRVDRTGGRGEKVFHGQAPRGLVNKPASFVSRLFMACFRGCRAHCKWQGQSVATRDARHEPESRTLRCEDFVTFLFLDLQRLEL